MFSGVRLSMGSFVLFIAYWVELHYNNWNEGVVQGWEHSWTCWTPKWEKILWKLHKLCNPPQTPVTWSLLWELSLSLLSFFSQREATIISFLPISFNSHHQNSLGPIKFAVNLLKMFESIAIVHPILCKWMLIYCDDIWIVSFLFVYHSTPTKKPMWEKIIEKKCAIL